MMKTFIAAAAFVVSSTGIALAQDIQKGAILFKQCAVCHKIGPGATNGIGPELNGLDDRQSGSVPSYSYSEQIRIPASYGTNRRLRNTSKIRKRKFRAPK